MSSPGTTGKMSTMPPSHQWNPSSSTGSMNSGSDTAIRTARRHGHVRVRARARVLHPVLLDVPDRRVRGDGHLGQRHVAEQLAIRSLEAVTANDARRTPEPTVGTRSARRRQSTST